ncbi:MULTISPECIES: ACP S-malonyltransferase [unclassified Moraxella]|uniref:ACP S-malonyltransferase n=1 Tax=unclassified Moraxella TaxID=2685852 RepID=UPI003AF86643
MSVATPSLTSPTLGSAHYAVIFPGQGSQSVGMLADWATQYPQIQQTFDEASEALGFDLWAVCQGTHPTFNLDDTAYTQPALLTASMAIWRVLQAELALTPSYLAGHSLGEYSALCASGVLSLADAVRLVHHRGQYMTEAMTNQQGKMSAILGLTDDEVSDICRQVVDDNAKAVVSPANFNATGQVVIAGNALGVDLASEAVLALGKKAMPLKVSVPSHCQLMKPASDKLANQFDSIEFASPRIPVMQNRHAKIETDVSAIKQALIEQLSEPVLWSTIEDNLANQGVTLQIECGSGAVLTNLAKRQAQKIPTLATDKVEKLEAIQQAINEIKK